MFLGIIHVRTLFSIIQFMLFSFDFCFVYSSASCHSSRSFLKVFSSCILSTRELLFARSWFLRSSWVHCNNHLKIALNSEIMQVENCKNELFKCYFRTGKMENYDRVFATFLSIPNRLFHLRFSRLKLETTLKVLNNFPLKKFSFKKKKMCSQVEWSTS